MKKLPKYEYDVIVCSAVAGAAKEKLLEKGEEGWHVVASKYHEGYGWSFVLERPIVEPHSELEKPMD